jgi:transcriptional regulator with XRE-family HTH domain
MIVKKLREEKHWSQEQVATMAGLSLRTIQRVEAGNPASKETLKSLASVFEIEVSKLTERVKVIDKESEDWQNVPFWVSFGLIGIKERKKAILCIFTLLICGAAFHLVLGFGAPIGISTFIWLSLYMTAVAWFILAVRWVDKQKLW